MRRAADVLLALAFAALLIPTVLFFRADVKARGTAEEFVRKFNVEIRRPEVARTVGYAPSSDWAGEMIADAALRDAFEPVNLTEATPREREAWIRAAAQVDDELRFARGSLLDAIALRPGWPFYQSMLGQTVFAIESRAFSPDLIQKSETWSTPLLYAADAAPAVLTIWKSLAAAYLQTWPVIHHAAAPRVFRNAFTDPEFVGVAFADAARLLGDDVAIRYVPDSPHSLRAAFDFFAKSNDVPHAWPLHQRWESAEWKQRGTELAEIEGRATRRDADDLRSRCDQWISSHSVWNFDSPAAHAQAARILELWPGGRRGMWSNDPLADVARYLLTRNSDLQRFAPAIARTIESFSGVPAPTLAVVQLASGNVTGAERIAQSAEDAGSLEWAPYLLALTRHYQLIGAKGQAEAAFARLPAAAQETHEALLVRGDKNAAEGGGAPLCGAQPLLPLHGNSTARIRVTADAPTIVDIGLNRARSASLLVDKASDVAFTLVDYRDQTLWSRPVAGDSRICITAE